MCKKNKLGKPTIYYNNKVKKILYKKFKSKKFNVYVSLSDEKQYSIAYVIINKLWKKLFTKILKLYFMPWL